MNVLEDWNFLTCSTFYAKRSINSCWLGLALINVVRPTTGVARSFCAGVQSLILFGGKNVASSFETGAMPQREKSQHGSSRSASFANSSKEIAEIDEKHLKMLKTSGAESAAAGAGFGRQFENWASSRLDLA